MTRPELLEQLAVIMGRLVDERVNERLAALGIYVVADLSSENPPPGVTRRLFNSWCREGRVPGATRNGRSWTCSTAAWREARARGPQPKTTPQPDNVVSLDALLHNAGMRPTRGTR